ncbi:MAG: 30S ribosomal protein S20 [Lentisphaeria bacterium]|nr:30S ribosomal protein S20 [Lentisphaeria bacterium]MBR7119436.1 30S ribosomal protein S20 [Lentisphaeria bacterium]
MAHMKSAIKRIRTSREANLRNRARISELKTVEKKLRAAVEANDAAAAAEFARKFASILDKAAKVGTIHANRAANKKSQADKLIAAMAK